MPDIDEDDRMDAAAQNVINRNGNAGGRQTNINNNHPHGRNNPNALVNNSHTNHQLSANNNATANNTSFNKKIR